MPHTPGNNKENGLKLRWLPRVITNIVLVERELQNETYLISLQVFPRGDLPAWVLLK